MKLLGTKKIHLIFSLFKIFFSISKFEIKPSSNDKRTFLPLSLILPLI